MTPWRKLVLSSIVEGHGEKTAVPVLLKRLARKHLGPGLTISIPGPQRLQRDRMVKAEYLGPYLDFAAAETISGGAVFIFLDADDDAACTIGPRLQTLAATLRSDRQIIVCVCEREFEALFLAGAESLGLASAADPRVRDAKGEVRRLVGAYSPTVDQAAFTERVSLEPSQGLSLQHIARLDEKVRSVIVAAETY